MTWNELRKPLLLCMLMLAAAGLALAATPSKHLADSKDKVDLEKMIPQVFGEWRVDAAAVPIVTAPDVQAKLDNIYDQTLSRTYVNAMGDRVMLSIAYGGDQSDSMQVHRPEVCYTAQGFQVMRQAIDSLTTQYGALPIKRVLAVMGRRNEPITYWVIVGYRATYVGLKQKLAQLKYGLTGSIPDGLLVRVSSIEKNEAGAYLRHDEFIRLMLGAMQDRDRVKLTGRFEG
jgi:EpsI family protein